MELRSSSFQHMSTLPSRFASRGVTGGSNLSPELSWSNAPAGSLSTILYAIDIHPVAGNWIHWLVINIPSRVSSIAEGASPQRMPPGALELYNSFGSPGYGGPMPPKGSGLHRYVFTIAALDLPTLDLEPHTSLTALHRAIEGHVLASASLTGLFER